MKKTFLKIMIITFIISAILGISIIFLDLWNNITCNILFSTGIIFGFSIPGLACSVNYDKSNNKNLAISGIIFCFISCLYFLLLIWDIIDFNFFNTFYWNIGMFCILISSSFGHICLLLLVNSSDKIVNYTKIATIVLSIIIDILLSIMIFTKIDIDWKLLSIIAILIVLGTLITPLLNKLKTKQE